MVNVAQSVYIEPQWTAEQVLASIADKESSDSDVVQHPDGVSFKKYGLTYASVQESHSKGKLSWCKHPREMNDSEQLEAALAYLSLMKERFYRSNDHQEGHADHGGHKCTCASDRREYVRAIRSRLERHYPPQG
jgi:hypothetical protein